MVSDTQISVVLPVYKNSAVITILYNRLVSVLSEITTDFELIFVNDASPDDANIILNKLVNNDQRIKLITHSKNLGQHTTIFSGLQIAQYKFIVTMDADLQDEPEEIPRLLNALQSTESDAVFAGKKGVYQSLNRMFFSKIFKWIIYQIARIPVDAGSFVIMKKELVQKLLCFKKSDKPFLSVMIGFNSSKIISLPVKRKERIIGYSAYSTWMRLTLGVTVLFNAIKWRLQND